MSGYDPSPASGVPGAATTTRVAVPDDIDNRSTSTIIAAGTVVGFILVRGRADKQIIPLPQPLTKG